jgi:hypothetical protein
MSGTGKILSSILPGGFVKSPILAPLFLLALTSPSFALVNADLTGVTVAPTPSPYTGTWQAATGQMKIRSTDGYQVSTDINYLYMGPLLDYSNSGIAKGFAFAVKGNGTADAALIIRGYTGFSNTSPGGFPQDSQSFRDVLTVVGNGNIGIGIANPANKLSVAGTISAKEVRVNSTGADYVFEDSHRLMPLDELEGFIKANKHLPGIEPAREMEKNGLPVSATVTAQLAKIEELTLYAIEQNKQAKELKAELQAQKTINLALEARLTALETRK